MSRRQIEGTLIVTLAIVFVLAVGVGMRVALYPALTADYSRAINAELPTTLAAFLEATPPGESGIELRRFARLRPDYRVVFRRSDDSVEFDSHPMRLAPEVSKRVNLSSVAGGGSVELSMVPAEAGRVSQRITEQVTSFLLVGLACVVGMGLLLVHAIFAPIRGLIRFTRAIRLFPAATSNVSRSKQFREIEIEIEQTVFAVGRAADELRRAEEGTADVVAKLVHDLRLPLTVISGYLQRLAEHPAALGEEKRTWVIRIGESIARLREQLRPLCSLDDEKRVEEAFRPEVSDLGLLAREVIEVYAEPAAAQRVSLGLKGGILQPIMVEMDRGLIFRVLSNLIANALRFTDAGGSVGLGLEWNEDQTIRCSVSDTGAGIPAGKIPLIGEPFFRAHADSHHHLGGTGLGLSASKQFLKLHRSSLVVESIEGNGSTFSFVLATRRTVASELKVVPKKSVDRSVMLVSGLVTGYVVCSRLISFLVGRPVQTLPWEIGLVAAVFVMGGMASAGQPSRRFRGLTPLIHTLLLCIMFGSTLCRAVVQAPTTALGDTAQALLAIAVISIAWMVGTLRSWRLGLIGGLVVGTTISQVVFGGFFLLVIVVLLVMFALSIAVVGRSGGSRYSRRCCFALTILLIAFESLSIFLAQQNVTGIVAAEQLRRNPGVRFVEWIEAEDITKRPQRFGYGAAFLPGALIFTGGTAPGQYFAQSFYASEYAKAAVDVKFSLCGTVICANLPAVKDRAKSIPVDVARAPHVLVAPVGILAETLLERLSQRQYVRDILPIQILLVFLCAYCFDQWLHRRVTGSLASALAGRAPLRLVGGDSFEGLLGELFRLRTEQQAIFSRLASEAAHRQSLMLSMGQLMDAESKKWSGQLEGANTLETTWMVDLKIGVENVVSALQLLLDYFRIRSGKFSIHAYDDLREFLENSLLDLEESGWGCSWRLSQAGTEPIVPESELFGHAAAHLIRGVALLSDGDLVVAINQTKREVSVHVSVPRSSIPGRVDLLRRLIAELHLARVESLQGDECWTKPADGENARCLATRARECRP